jgi:transcription initiation factor TFIID subunit 6
VLSKESQELFNKLSGALIDETNVEWQTAALAAISTEPGIHQLTTYLLSFIAEKVTHNMKNLFVLSQMMRAAEALLKNQAIYLDPYVAYMVPPILTCCIGAKLGPTTQQAPSNASSETLNGNGTIDYNRATTDPFYLRSMAASLLSAICKKHSGSNQGLKSRIARTCLKQFMDPDKSVGTHFGALQALLQVLGPGDALRGLILPNLKNYNDDFLARKMADNSTRHDTEILVDVLVGSLTALLPQRQIGRANGAPPALNWDESKSD